MVQYVYSMNLKKELSSDGILKTIGFVFEDDKMVAFRTLLLKVGYYCVRTKISLKIQQMNHLNQGKFFIHHPYVERPWPFDSHHFGF